VLESDHTVILGWSPQVFTIISELMIANENRKHGAAIAILAENDKVEMEEEIYGRFPHMKETPRSSAGREARSTRPRSRSSAPTRHARSSSYRKAKTRIHTSSNPSWHSPTIRTAAPNPITS